MTAITNKVASDRNISVWVVPEVVPGVLVPPSPGNLIAAYDVTYPKQIPEYENSKERAQTRDVLDRCKGQMPAGEFGFTTSCRPDGLGNPPAERYLMSGLTGAETINPTEVTYSLTLQKQSFSVWFLIDHTLVFCAGATIGGLKVTMDNCPIEFVWTGQFMQMGVTGTDSLTSLVAVTDVDFNVSDTDKFTVGGLVVLADAAGVVVDDNGGAGYRIVDIGENNIVSETGALIGVGVDGFVAPFDAGGTIAGHMLESASATVEIGGVAKPIISFTVEISDQPEYLDREKTPSGYPEGYAEIQREVTGEIDLSFRRDDAVYFKQAIEGDEQTVSLKVGTLEGYKLIIPMPRCVLEVPEIEEDTPIVQLKTKYQAIAVTGEDSYSVVYE